MCKLEYAAPVPEQIATMMESILVSTGCDGLRSNLPSQAAPGGAPTTTTTPLLDWKSPTLAPLARCGSGCSRSVMQSALG